MLKIHCIILVLCLSGILFAQDMKVEEVKIDNGPNLVLISDDKTEYVGISIFVKLNEDTSGLAHLGEHMVFGTNSKLGAGELDIITETLGTTIDAYTNYDFSVYKTIVKSSNVEDILKNVSYALLTPACNEKEIELEKQIIDDEFSSKKYVSFDYVRNLLLKELYGDSYYGNPIEGEDISKLGKDELKTFYDNNYFSKNMFIVVAGKFDSKNIVNIVKKYYVQDSKKISFNIPIEFKKNKGAYIHETSKKGYYGIMYDFAPSYLEGESITCDVLSSLIDSICYFKIKEKYPKIEYKYTHSTQKWGSPFSLIYKTDNQEDVRSIVNSVILSVASGGFTENDLLNAKSNILSDYLSKNENLDSMAYNIGFTYLMYDFNMIGEYNKYISGVSRNDIILASKKYLINPVEIKVGEDETN